MKRKTILLLICIVIILCLTGCGAHTEISSADDSVSNSATDDTVSIETITEISETETSETTSAPTPDTEQKDDFWKTPRIDVFLHWKYNRQYLNDFFRKSIKNELQK